MIIIHYVIFFQFNIMEKTIEIYPKLFIEIKPWICPICTFINETHPYYCQICGYELENYSIVNSNTKYKSINKKRRVERVFGTSKGILLPVLSCYNEKQFKINIEKLYSYFDIRKCQKNNFYIIKSIIFCFSEFNKLIIDFLLILSASILVDTKIFIF